MVSAILPNLSQDLGVGIANMTINRNFSETYLALILASF
jgi:hypothetical protein